MGGSWPPGGTKEAGREARIAGGPDGGAGTEPSVGCEMGGTDAAGGEIEEGGGTGGIVMPGGGASLPLLSIQMPII